MWPKKILGALTGGTNRAIGLDCLAEKLKPRLQLTLEHPLQQAAQQGHEEPAEAFESDHRGVVDASSISAGCHEVLAAHGSSRSFHVVHDAPIELERSNDEFNIEAAAVLFNRYSKPRARPEAAFRRRLRFDKIRLPAFGLLVIREKRKNELRGSVDVDACSNGYRLRNGHGGSRLIDRIKQLCIKYKYVFYGV